MNILLPPKTNSTEQITVNSNSLIVIGANGAGKTRLGANLEATYEKVAHRVSAQKSLSMPKEVSPKSKIRAEAEFLYGHYYDTNPSISLQNRKNNRWGQNPNTFLLNDYEKLMVLLHTEEYEESIKFKEGYEPGQDTQKPITKLDRIQSIWEYVLPHRKINKKAGSIETYPTDNPDKNYNASEMSDGERVIFYLIGEVVSVPENSLVIIDEPEMHIHKSIIKKLWNEIEQERPDCTFVYLTHDIDFAASRQNATKIWVKNYDGTSWDYEILENHNDLPEQLYLEILGSRKPILFIEGNETSIDYKLLQLVFSEYTIKPIGSCDKVFETTKSFNSQQSFHRIDSYGLIDRDRRTNSEIENINSPNIWVAKVAEIENFLLIEDVVKAVAINMMKDSDHVFELVKNNVIEFFNSQIEKQAVEHTISRIDRIFKNSTDNGVKTFEELQSGLDAFWSVQDFQGIYNELKAYFQELVSSKNYTEILRVFNNKGLVANSNVISLCDLSSKNNAYLNHIIGILKKSNGISESIRKAIINHIQK